MMASILEFLQSFWGMITTPIVLGPLSLPFSVLKIFLQAVVPIGLMLFIYRFVRWIEEKLIKKADTREELANRIRRITKIILRVLYATVIILAVSSLFGAELFVYFKKFYGILNEPFFSSGKTSISIITVILLIPVFMVANWAGRLTKQLLENSLFNRLGLDEARRFSISSLSRYLVMVLVVILGLALIGVDLSAIGVLLGVLGIGLGFGLQNIVANFFAGMVIISTRPIKEQDRISVNGIEGTIKQIRMLSTNVVTLENENIIIPNSKIVSEAVHNFSHDDRKVVMVNRVQVSYLCDLEQVIQVLEETAKSYPFAMTGEIPEVRVLAFQDSGILVELRSWIRDVNLRPQARSAMNLEIWRRFRKHGIQIPFPQMDVHINPQHITQQTPVKQSDDSENQ